MGVMMPTVHTAVHRISRTVIRTWDELGTAGGERFHPHSGRVSAQVSADGARAGGAEPEPPSHRHSAQAQQAIARPAPGQLKVTANSCCCCRALRASGFLGPRVEGLLDLFEPEQPAVLVAHVPPEEVAHALVPTVGASHEAITVWRAVGGSAGRRSDL